MPHTSTVTNNTQAGYKIYMPLHPVAHVTAHCELAEVEQPDASTYPVDADGVGQAPEPPGMTVIFNILM